MLHNAIELGPVVFRLEEYIFSIASCSSPGY